MKKKVLFKKETEIWIHADNDILCGNLCKHLVTDKASLRYAKCNLFNETRYPFYIGENIIGFYRTGECFNLEEI